MCLAERSCVFRDPCADHGRELAPDPYASIRAKITAVLSWPFGDDLDDGGTGTDTLTIVIGDAVPVLIKPARGARPHARVHLAMVVQIRQPPRGGNGGRWFRRDPGETICPRPYEYDRATVPAPANVAADCPECLAIADARGIQPSRSTPAVPKPIAEPISTGVPEPARWQWSSRMRVPKPR